jgi:hypothetical protein
LHTGGRSAPDIDAGGVLPGYTGIIVRDGYARYHHLTGALHAWCGQHLLRDLKDIYDFEPAQQAWASGMAALLVRANQAAGQAGAAGATCLGEDALASLLASYRALAAEGLDANQHRRTRAARDALRVARRFRDYEPERRRQRGCRRGCPSARHGGKAFLGGTHFDLHYIGRHGHRRSYGSNTHMITAVAVPLLMPRRALQLRTPHSGARAP